MSYIVACKMDGLGNSIKNMLSTYRIAKLNNYTPIIIDKRLMDIFTNIDNQKNVKIFSCIRSSADWHISENDYLDKYPNDFLVSHDKYRTILNKYGEYTIEQLYHLTPKNILSQYKDIIFNLKINQKIANYIENFINDNLADKKIASFHIRTWNGDKWKVCEKSRNRNKDYYNYLIWDDTIRQYINEGYIPFICSDDTELVNNLSKKYNIITHRYSNSNLDFKQWELDFIDIILMGKSEIFVGSFLSSFSELVYYFSNTIKKTVII